jgi:hypothetical protein
LFVSADEGFDPGFFFAVFTVVGGLVLPVRGQITKEIVDPDRV